MNVGNVSNVSFGYKCILKTEYLKGALGKNVKYGLYGGRLTPATVSTEHLIPKSRGGTLRLGNTALATKANNNARGSAPLARHLTQEQADRYFNQFRGVRTEDGLFNGDTYIKQAGETVKRLLEKGNKKKP